jgi:hypothetical protein
MLKELKLGFWRINRWELGKCGLRKVTFAERSCLLIEFRDEDLERDLGLKRAIARIDKIAAIFRVAPSARVHGGTVSAVSRTSSRLPFRM